MVIQDNGRVTLKTQIWLVAVVVIVAMLVEVMSLNGPNVCMVKQKYNITKRIKYRAPMTVRTYEWCFSMPPKCSKYKTEMRDLTRLETEERTAEVAVCCPGYKMKDVSCVPICPNGKTGSGCSEECPSNKWGPNCVNDCKICSDHGSCSPITGECVCQDGWKGERCSVSMPATTTKTTTVELLTTKPTTKTTILSTTPMTTTTRASFIETPTIVAISPSTTNTEATLRISATMPISAATNTLNTSPLIVATEKDFYETTSMLVSTESEKETTLSNIISTTIDDGEIFDPTTADSTRRIMITNYTKNEILLDPTKASTAITIEINTAPSTKLPRELNNIVSVTEPTKSITSLKSTKESVKAETTKKPELALKFFPTTVKFKPKEIWIKPAQKGESQFVETKAKPTHELAHPRYRSATNKDFTPNTTPKTIIVSIIPTSVSYVTFKKIALTTASFSSQKANPTTNSYNKSSEQGFTKAMSVPTFTPSPFTTILNMSSSSKTPISTFINVSKHAPSTSITSRTLKIVKSTTSIETNSTTGTTVTTKLNSFNHLTTTVSSTNQKIHLLDISEKKSASKVPNTTKIEKVPKFFTHIVKTTENNNRIYNSTNVNNVTILTNDQPTTATPVKIIKPNVKDTDNNNKITTEDPSDEEAFHILTEPEHITAVMGEKGKERTSVDLVSVISIAGGVMMSVITVAVIIVMIERCKRHDYEDVRKMNDIRMQVMIDDDIPPPPYVRSIFHTPLPDPPTSEKCHYQPISTLDRNLKQFMRPVVVQNISPIMLENFRGILECHYDHLPRRSHDFESMQPRCSIAPSLEDVDEIHHIRACNVTESTIEALKCEARLDVIDSTTSEPLYAEIPFWRPPSEHAIEIINLNGEAVTEL